MITVLNLAKMAFWLSAGMITGAFLFDGFSVLPQQLIGTWGLVLAAFIIDRLPE